MAATLAVHQACSRRSLINFSVPRWQTNATGICRTMDNYREPAFLCVCVCAHVRCAPAAAADLHADWPARATAPPPPHHRHRSLWQPVHLGQLLPASQSTASVVLVLDVRPFKELQRKFANSRKVEFCPIHDSDLFSQCSFLRIQIDCQLTWRIQSNRIYISFNTSWVGLGRIILKLVLECSLMIFLLKKTPILEPNWAKKLKRWSVAVGKLVLDDPKWHVPTFSVNVAVSKKWYPVWLCGASCWSRKLISSIIGIFVSIHLSVFA